MFPRNETKKSWKTLMSTESGFQEAGENSNQCEANRFMQIKNVGSDPGQEDKCS